MGDQTPQITLHDFLTDAEINRCVELKDRKAVRDQIILPNMARIDAKLGQKNDPDYLSYAIEYVMTAGGAW